MSVATAMTAVMMGETEARACLLAINTKFADIGHALLDLYEREGWKALGYESYRDCVREELGLAATTCYVKLTAARVERMLSQSGNPVRLPQAQATELARLDSPEAIRETWDEIEASLGTDERVTAARVKTAVDRRVGTPVPSSAPRTSAHRDDDDSAFEDAPRPERPSMAPSATESDRAAAMVGGHTRTPSGPAAPSNGSSGSPQRSGTWVEKDVDQFVNFADSYFSVEEVRESIEGLTRVLFDKRKRQAPATS